MSMSTTDDQPFGHLTQSGEGVFNLNSGNSFILIFGLMTMKTCMIDYKCFKNTKATI